MPGNSSNSRSIILFSSKPSGIMPPLVVDFPFDVANRNTQFHKMFTKKLINKPSLVCVYSHNGNCCGNSEPIFGRILFVMMECAACAQIHNFIPPVLNPVHGYNFPNVRLDCGISLVKSLSITLSISRLNLEQNTLT